MDNWLTHTLTAALGIIVGSLPAFVLKLRQQTSGEWKTIVCALRQRIEVLESRIETLHGDHVRCLAVQGELRAKIALLEAKITKENAQ